MNAEFYEKFFKHILFSFPPDMAHDLVQFLLLFPEFWKKIMPSFQNQYVGIPAGFIKDGDPRKIQSVMTWGPSVLVVGSVTRYPKERNPRPNLIRVGSGSALNSYGLNNPGIDVVLQNLSKLPKRYPIWLSIAGKYEDIIYCIEQSEKNQYIVGYEINLSCPNTECGSETYERNPLLCEKLIYTIRDKTQRPIHVKISPFVFGLEGVSKELVEKCAEAGCNGFVATNSLGVPDNRFYRRFAGLSGENIFLPGRYGDITHYGSYETLRKVIEITGKGYTYWGCGGVNSQERVDLMLNLGAKKVLVYTAIPYTYGPWTFQKFIHR